MRTVLNTFHCQNSSFCEHGFQLMAVMPFSKNTQWEEACLSKECFLSFSQGHWEWDECTSIPAKID